MNRSLHTVFLVSFLLVSLNFNAQKYKFIGHNESLTLKFELINNLIILPIEVNGSKLKFILDSGVSSMVIFNMHSSDSLEFKNLVSVKLRGLGEGESVDALLSKRNRVKMESIFNSNQDLFIIYNEKLDLSGKLGIEVNGIIGYDILKDFIVTINYSNKKITFTKPESFVYKKCRSCETFDLFFYKNKPFIEGKIVVENPNYRKISVQLLIDSGGTDSLWLFEDQEKGIKIPENSFKDFIGEGISGGIFGMRSRIKSFELKRFVIKNPNVAYLDSVSTAYAKGLTTRNGSLGGNILKRFNVILDYPNSKMTLKKNKNFSDEFNYNMSGIELIHGGKTLVKELKKTVFNVDNNRPGASTTNTITFDYAYGFSLKPVYKIAYIRKDSPAEKSGLLVGDYLTKINGRHAYNYKLQSIVQKFYAGEGKLLRISVDRNGKELNFELRLKNLL